jgi:hypothetical protein
MNRTNSENKLFRGQTLADIWKTSLTNRVEYAHNKGLKEMAGEAVNQTFVLLINSCSRLTVRAFKPPLL